MFSRFRQYTGSAVILFALLLIGHSLYLPAKAVMAQELLNLAWKRAQETGQAVKPWPWADTHPVARLSFPRLGDEFIVLAGSMGRTLAFGPGHLTGSAAPDQQGHIIISGHRDSHFSGLKVLRSEDIIWLETIFGEKRLFRVTEVAIVDSRHEPLWIEQDNRLTLVTCYPFNALQAGGPLRYRVDAVAI